MTHFLITGHTGFKGSWLTSLLVQMGHKVSGLALDPESPSLFEACGLHTRYVYDVRCDIRDRQATQRTIAQIQPDVMVHLAAQPLVLKSFEEPRRTIETNVNGTLNVLEAVSLTESIRASLIVTTDKVYRKSPSRRTFSEGDPLGGDDPYSASKAMADIATRSWVLSFPSPPTAIARAGNVIGGGDYGRDRLIPDIVAAFAQGTEVQLRFPSAVRPWQHVLDCLGGYLVLIDALLSGSIDAPGEAWNVGPDDGHYATVEELTEIAFRMWGTSQRWSIDPTHGPTENSWLALNSDKLRSALGWSGRLDLEEATAWTIEWYQRVFRGEDPTTVTTRQVAAYLEKLHIDLDRLSTESA